MVSILNKMIIRNKQAQYGFGLIEMMVSVGIMVLVTSIVLVRQSTFNSAVLLENQAYEIAFDIRQTQLRAVSAQGGVDADFRAQYGVTFVPGENQYYFFRGDPGDNNFLGAPGQLDRRFSIVAVQRPNGVNMNNGVHVTFERPEYNADFFFSGGRSLNKDWVNIYICADDDSTNMSSRLNNSNDLRYDMNNDGVVSSADLDLIRSFSGGECNFRRIKITNTGQITVN